MWYIHGTLGTVLSYSQLCEIFNEGYWVIPDTEPRRVVSSLVSMKHLTGNPPVYALEGRVDKDYQEFTRLCHSDYGQVVGET